MSQILWAFAIGCGFVLWPIAGKFLGMNGSWVTTIVVVGTSLSALALASQSAMASGVPSIRSCLLLLIAGVVNGVALYFYSVKAADPLVSTGVFITTVTTVMLVMGPVLGYFLNGETLSSRQVAGLIGAVVSVYLLAG